MTNDEDKTTIRKYGGTAPAIDPNRPLLSVDALKRPAAQLTRSLRLPYYRTVACGQYRRREVSQSLIIVTEHPPESAESVLFDMGYAPTRNLWRSLFFLEASAADTVNGKGGDFPVFVVSVKPVFWGAAVICYTGPIGFYRKLCRRARTLGLKFGNGGLKRGAVVIDSSTERSVFTRLYVPRLRPAERRLWNDPGIADSEETVVSDLVEVISADGNRVAQGLAPGGGHDGGDF